MKESLRRILYLLHWCSLAPLIPFIFVFSFNLIVLLLYNVTPNDKPEFHNLSRGQVRTLSCYGIAESQNLQNLKVIPGDFVYNNELYRIKEKTSFSYKTIQYVTSNIICTNNDTALAYTVFSFGLFIPIITIIIIQFIFFGRIFLFPWNFSSTISTETVKNTTSSRPTNSEPTFSSSQARTYNPAEDFFTKQRDLNSQGDAVSVLSSPDQGYQQEPEKRQEHNNEQKEPPGALSSKPSDNLSKASLALTYRPELAAILDKNISLSNYEKLLVDQKLEQNPKIPAETFSKYISDINNGHVGPFKDGKSNKIFAALYDFGTNYQDKFKQIHDALGDTFDPDFVFLQIEAEFLNEKYPDNSPYIQKPVEGKFLIKNELILRCLPFKNYETSKHRILINNTSYTIQSKGDNFFTNCSTVDELIKKIEYNIDGDLWHNGYKVNASIYWGHLILETGAREVYVASLNNRKQERPSRNHYVLPDAKRWIDANRQ